MEKTEKKTLGIYVHVPFCKSKCGYCDFCSHPPKSKSETERYLHALMLHMQDFAGTVRKYTVDTVYIGGGTPTMLSAGQMKELCACIRDTFSLAPDAEWTVEANPGTVDRAYLRLLRKCGVNRLSFGLQSASDRELRALGRIHTFADFAESYAAARKAGFKNVSVDLMYGIPHQTADSFSQTLDTVTALAPEHISVYGLKIEENTRFYEERDRLPLPDEETEYRMFRTAHEKLGAAGYRQYEISNYARPGFASRHNKRYWLDAEYLGFGVAAHSYFGGKRFAYTTDMDAYIREMEHPKGMASILTECTDIDDAARETEYVMLRLRLTEGLSYAAYRAAFGADFLARYGDRLKKYVDGGFVRMDGEGCAFTLKGIYVSNYILSDILDF